jgi:aminoglycoside phosphotransferase family enzyme
LKARFDETRRSIDCGRADDALARKLAETMAMHARAGCRCQFVIAALDRFLPRMRWHFWKRPLFPPDRGQLNHAARATLERLRPLANRGRRGLIRGHGDLHLGNIALWKGVHCRSMRRIRPDVAGDVLYDLAFF